uniref:Uncharacterized protein n=1 Tax=Arundo donax TaxID=35708 RepID=A0A0A9E3N4_ARUDO
METYVDLSWGPVVSCLNTRKSMLGRCFNLTPISIPTQSGFASSLTQPTITRSTGRWKTLRFERWCSELCATRLSQLIARTLRNPRTFMRYNPELLEVQLMQLFEGRTS